MLDAMANQSDNLEPIDIVRKNLRMAIAFRNTTASEVARQAGLSRNAVSQFIAGHTSMSHGNLLDVCNALTIPVGILHKPDAISENRIRLYTILDRLPDHLQAEALQAAIGVARAHTPARKSKDEDD